MQIAKPRNINNLSLLLIVLIFCQNSEIILHLPAKQHILVNTWKQNSFILCFSLGTHLIIPSSLQSSAYRVSTSACENVWMKINDFKLLFIISKIQKEEQ